MDYDKFGYCVMCHQSLLIADKNDKGEKVERLSGKAEHMDLNLNDGSKMRVLICTSCKIGYSHEKHSEEIMQSVIRGWEKECEILVADQAKPHFDEKWKENYMKVYGEKEIVA